MQFVTQSLMNEPKPKGRWLSLLKTATAGDVYYEAQSLDGQTQLLWIEANRMNKNHAFPCLLRQGENWYFYETSRDPDTRRRQEEMILLWEQVVTPENVRTDYEVKRLSESEFRKRYAALRAQSRLENMLGDELTP